MSNRSITLTDADGAIVSILEIPEHASEAQAYRIRCGVLDLVASRGLYWDGGFSRDGQWWTSEAEYLAHVRAAALSPRGFLPALES